MDEEIKTKWIDALRSGNYKQGRGRLRKVDDRYCCLGVLCDIVSPEQWVWGPDEGWQHSGWTHGEAGTDLPSADILEKAGIPNSAPPGSDDRTIINILARQNDIEGWTFNKIADFIKNEL